MVAVVKLVESVRFGRLQILISKAAAVWEFNKSEAMQIWNCGISGNEAEDEIDMRDLVIVYDFFSLEIDMCNLVIFYFCFFWKSICAT